MRRSSPSPGKKKALLAFLTMIIASLVLLGGCMLSMPGHSHKAALPPLSADQELLSRRLREDVVMLAETIGERNVQHYAALQQADRYITSRLTECSLPVRREPYTVSGKEVVNIEAELKGTVHPEEIVVIGAHYDSVAGTPGANDNGSGVAAMLELACMFKDTKPNRTIRFVAFVNEEPPWFQTEEMGSMVYARRAKEQKENVVAAISLETIGCYSDHPKSQAYPLPFSLFYPDTGNFIAFVGDFRSRSLLRRSIGTFRSTTPFPSEGVAAPRAIPGIGWSDHWSFWQVGYPALMVTDTAPFRYGHYHGSGDTPEKLDYGRMARVTEGVGRVVEELAGK